MLLIALLAAFVSRFVSMRDYRPILNSANLSAEALVAELFFSLQAKEQGVPPAQF